MKETAISESESRPDPAPHHGDPLVVDRSIRIPVLIFFGSGVFWLVVASVFYLLSSSQMLQSKRLVERFPGIDWLSFGRAYPVFLNCYVYGWATCAGFGTGIWLLSRLTGVPLRSPLPPILAAVVWNIGMVTGVLSILDGATTGRELLEFPPETAFILFLGLAMVSFWAITIVWNQKTGADLYFAMVSSRSVFVVRMDVRDCEHLPWALRPHLGRRSRRSIGGTSAV